MKKYNNNMSPEGRIIEYIRKKEFKKVAEIYNSRIAFIPFDLFDNTLVEMDEKLAFSEECRYQFREIGKKRYQSTQ